MRVVRTGVAAIGWVALLALAAPSFAQDPCLFQSHSVDPPSPAPDRPFTVTVNVLAACIAYHDAVVTPGLVSVDVECACPIDPSPPPEVWSHTFEVPGLEPGALSVEFRKYSQPTLLYYSFGLVIGSAQHVPAIGGVGAALLALLLAAVAMRSLGPASRGGPRARPLL